MPELNRWGEIQLNGENISKYGLFQALSASGLTKN